MVDTLCAGWHERPEREMFPAETLEVNAHNQLLLQTYESRLKAVRQVVCPVIASARF